MQKKHLQLLGAANVQCWPMTGHKCPNTSGMNLKRCLPTPSNYLNETEIKKLFSAWARQQHHLTSWFQVRRILLHHLTLTKCLHLLCRISHFLRRCVCCLNWTLSGGHLTYPVLVFLRYFFHMLLWWFCLHPTLKSMY